MTDIQDTDLLIGIVSSLLHRKFETDDILDALIRCHGDAPDAAKLLNSGSESEKTSKVREADGGKKRGRGLDDWLGAGSSRKIARKEPEANLTNPGLPSSPNSTASSSTNTKSKTVDLMSVLRQPPPSKKTVPQKPPLLLSNPAMVAEHAPCTLHLSVLPSELASKLFYTMQDASRSWNRNKWWLFDRLVESPHRTSFFARRTDGITSDSDWQQAAQFWYNGRPTGQPEVFSPPMEEACEIIEKLVSEELRKRPRHPLEWAGDDPSDLLWRANVAASNCYEGRNESVGWHSDQVSVLQTSRLSTTSSNNCVPSR
ncbi:hypothetical protein V5O48_003856 [Marasmius crinis-equi]|uniref:Alpha-ketoglutarate-dependent dioxygenase AlkB-like domain-containing protein n=1 Tax=Marasmius crinis-equi TaxID=585013 RepID=A0ABR3FS36_9AGAR